ncbi:hypothetical protein OC709_02465, partial ['Planchonia careya' phytoplasma]
MERILPKYFKIKLNQRILGIMIFLVAAIDAFIVIFEGNVIINFIQNNFKNNSKIIYKDNIIL